jgi:large subunit ribosomal protein L32e
MTNPRKKPKFRRWMSHSLKRIKESWRRPRGMHSKIRRKEKGKLSRPSPGYGAPKEMKYLHPSGFKEVLVLNVKGLEKIDSKVQAVRIAHTVGGKKRKEILKKAEEKKIKVLNP